MVKSKFKIIYPYTEDLQISKEAQYYDAARTAASIKWAEDEKKADQEFKSKYPAPEYSQDGPYQTWAKNKHQYIRDHTDDIQWIHEKNQLTEEFSYKSDVNQFNSRKKTRPTIIGFLVYAGPDTGQSYYGTEDGYGWRHIAAKMSDGSIRRYFIGEYLHHRPKGLSGYWKEIVSLIEGTE